MAYTAVGLETGGLLVVAVQLVALVRHSPQIVTDCMNKLRAITLLTQ